MTVLEELTEGIWTWTAARRQRGAAEVASSYALRSGAGLLIVDPTLPEGREEATLRELHDLARACACGCFVTEPSRVHDAEEVVWALGGPVIGHVAMSMGLHDRRLFVDAMRDTPLPFGVRAHQVGASVQQQLALHVPDVRAVVFGTSVVGVDRGLRVQIPESTGAVMPLHWYDKHMRPSLEPLADMGIEHVLVTHGAPVIGAGESALRMMLATPPIAADAAPNRAHG